METPHTTGTAAKTARESAGLTPQELADKLDRSVSVVCDAEADRHETRVVRLIEIAAACNCGFWIDSGGIYCCEPEK